MNFNEARTNILELLRLKGRAKNSEMLALLDGDQELFDTVREDLLFSDMADDKKGVGLVYLGDTSLQPQDGDNTPPLAAAVATSPASPTVASFTYDVFLSFSSKDKDLAQRIFDALSEQRLKIFWSPVSLRDRTGAFWFEELGKALEQARHLVVLLSDDALKSPYVRLEYMTFYNLMLACKGRLLFPVYEKGFDLKELPVFLKQLQGYTLDRTSGISSVIAILTGVIADTSALPALVQPEKPDAIDKKWFEERRWHDEKGISWRDMKCRSCGKTLGCYNGEYVPPDFCPHCRAHALGKQVGRQEASRRPANPKLPIYDLAIAGVEPFARLAFSTEAFAPGPAYAAFESAVQEIMVRLELGEAEHAILDEFQTKKQQTPSTQRFWASEEALRDAKALRMLNIKAFPLSEKKEHPTGPQQFPDYHSPDAWYRVRRLDLYDDEWECKSCGKRGLNYARGTERPPKFCPYCGSEKQGC